MIGGERGADRRRARRRAAQERAVAVGRQADQADAHDTIQAAAAKDDAVARRDGAAAIACDHRQRLAAVAARRGRAAGPRTGRSGGNRRAPRRPDPRPRRRRNRNRTARSAGGTKPAAVRIVSIRSGSAKANGPCGGGGAAACSGAKRCHDRRSSAAQSILVARPEAGEDERRAGLGRPRRWAKAATGSSKNITPWRETRASKRRPSAGVQRDASPTSNVGAARRRARARRRSAPRTDRGR